MMFDLVTDKNGANIKVREIDGKCVCIACRGFKTMWNTVYWNSAAIHIGGIFHISQLRICQKCFGIGFWTENYNQQTKVI